MVFYNLNDSVIPLRCWASKQPSQSQGYSCDLKVTSFTTDRREVQQTKDNSQVQLWPLPSQKKKKFNSLTIIYEYSNI